MVDPNPGRGMPLQLQRYWLTGKGAAKIRWNVPGDFLRCVRQLRKYFPKDPKGLCNILHTKATGGPPGHGSAEHSILTITAASEALLAAQPELGPAIWAGPLAPIGRPTGEPRAIRVFEPGALQHRTLPLPLDHRRVTAQGHGGAVTVGRILGITYGPDDKGLDWAWGWGDWLDENIIPEVKQAKYLVEQGVAGPSVDPGGRIMATLNPETGAEHMMTYTIGGATLVSIPAFASMRLHTFDADGDWPDDDLDMVMDLEGDEDDCGCGGDKGRDGVDQMVQPIMVGPKRLVTASGTYSVNPDGWRGLPLAARESVFDNDDAVKRIAAWANWSAEGADVARLKRAFMWYDERLPDTDPTSYRLPVGDIVNGRLTLIFHAIYAAAALISGAHGGLPGISDVDKNKLRNVITEIYKVMAEEFNDSNVRAPWDRPENEGQQFAMSEDTKEYPVEPPLEWFQDPMLSGKTPLTIEDSGRVYGHLAAWNECHRDVSRRECILAPHSKLNYRPFHLGQVKVAEGATIKVGKIVQDTRHASINLGYMAAAIHYDDTGDEVAVVCAGEDQYGIWVAGSVVPEASRKKVAKLRRSPLSGDWRAVDGNLELTAALAVNVPAFPVYSMDGEDRLALVAAGTVFQDQEDDDVEEDQGIDQILAYFSAVAKGVTEMPDQEEVEEYDEDEAQEDRVQRLSEIREDEDIYAQRNRASRLDTLRSAASAPAYAPPAPAPAAPVAPAPAAPAPAAPAPAAQAPAPVDPAAVDPATGAEPTLEQQQLNRQMNARFAVVRRPDGSTPGQSAVPAQVPAEETIAPAAPVAPVPATAAPPAKE